MVKINACLSAVRPLLLSVALLLTLITMNSPAAAACAPGSRRVVIVDLSCCLPSPQVGVWKQNQECGTNGVWFSIGSRYCQAHSSCAG